MFLSNAALERRREAAYAAGLELSRYAADSFHAAFDPL